MADTNQNIERDRIVWIDRMRGIAILSVVIQHMTYSFGNDFIYHKLISISNMGVFFFISGYIMNETTRISTLSEALPFMKKKAIQLLLPLVTWCLIVRKYFFEDIALWQWATLEELFVFWQKPQLWFLLTLYGFSILFAVYRMVVKRSGGGGFCILYWLLANIISLGIWKMTDDFYNLTMYMPFFTLGVIVSSYNLLGILQRRWLIDASLLVILLLTMSWHSGQTSFQNIIIKIIVTMGMICLLYNICQLNWNKYVNGFLIKCGIYSLAIYCAHWPFNIITDITISKPTIVQNELVAFTITLCAAAISCYTCICFKQIVSRSHIMDLLLFGSMKKNRTLLLNKLP